MGLIQEKQHAPSGISHAWRALTHRNFRLFFSGQSVSLIGTWMTRVATSWLVYRLTGSALLLGLVGFVGQIRPFSWRLLLGYGSTGWTAGPYCSGPRRWLPSNPWHSPL